MLLWMASVSTQASFTRGTCNIVQGFNYAGKVVVFGFDTNIGLRYENSVNQSVFRHHDIPDRLKSL